MPQGSAGYGVRSYSFLPHLNSDLEEVVVSFFSGGNNHPVSCRKTLLPINRISARGRLLRRQNRLILHNRNTVLKNKNGLENTLYIRWVQSRHIGFPDSVAVGALLPRQSLVLRCRNTRIVGRQPIKRYRDLGGGGLFLPIDRFSPPQTQADQPTPRYHLT